MTAEEHTDGTVGKALQVLDMVAAVGQPVRFSELLAQSAYPKATLYRFLQTLTNQGMLSFDADHGTYSLGVRLVRLAHAAWQQSSLAPIARPYIDVLAEETGATVHLAQLDMGQVLYVDKRHAKRPVTMFAQAGKVGPAYCTGVGKAMLAFVSETDLDAALDRQSFYRHTEHTLDSAEALRRELLVIRATGYALDREEHESGIICCAAPIITRAGTVIGALSVTSTTALTTLAALEAGSTRTIEIAGQIASAAESWRFPEKK